MPDINIIVKITDTSSKALQNLAANLVEEVESETYALTFEFNNKVQQNIRNLGFAGATGELQGSAYVTETKDGYETGVSAKHAAYVEFGTGAQVSIPNDPILQQLAAEAKNQEKGSFATFLEKIKEWMKRAGVHAADGKDDELAYLICVSILHKGLKPRPFLYPAVVWAEAEFPKRIENVIKQLSK